MIIFSLSFSLNLLNLIFWSDMQKRLIILSGPSCVGKTPLLKALNRTHAEIDYGSLTLYTSRTSRPIEQDGIDFHFRNEKIIKSFPRDQYIIGPVRHLWQAIDLEEVKRIFNDKSLIILELYPTLRELFQSHPLVRELEGEFHVSSVFIAPFSEEELELVHKSMNYASLQETAASIMTPKLISRSMKQGKLMTPQEMKDIEIRTSRAYEEIQMAKDYDYLIINHDGEDSDHWHYTPPLGDAGQTLRRLVEIIQS